MWPFPFRNKVALVHCSLILLQGINLPHGELSYSTLKLSYSWMGAVSALTHSPVGAASPGHSPRWCFGKVSLIQLSSRSEQIAVLATSLAFFGIQVPGVVLLQPLSGGHHLVVWMLWASQMQTSSGGGTRWRWLGPCCAWATEPRCARCHGGCSWRGSKATVGLAGSERAHSCLLSSVWVGKRSPASHY